MRDHYPPSRPRRRGTRATARPRWLADSLHARPVRPVRRLRRPPARPRQPGAGGGAGAAARAGRASRRRPCAPRSRGWSLQGWLEPVPADRRPRLPRHRRRSGGSTRPAPGSTAPAAGAWDGRWQLVFARPAGQRAGRDPAARRAGVPGVRRAGRRRLDRARSPRAELDELLHRARATAPRACAADFELDPDAGRRLGPRRARRGVRRVAGAGDAARSASHPDARRPGRAAFAARFHLVHEWRKFLFADPGLPDELLPARLARPAGRRAVHRRGRPAQARRRPLRRPVPGTRDGRSIAADRRSLGRATVATDRRPARAPRRSPTASPPSRSTGPTR